MGKQTKSYPCGAFTLKEGEQAGRKIDVGTVSGTEEIVVKIILYVYTHVWIQPPFQGPSWSWERGWSKRTTFPVFISSLGPGSRSSR